MAEMRADAVLLVISWLRQAQIRAYISGGWGIDALLGYQTRPHADLDVAFDANTDQQIMHLFGAAGYLVREDARPVRLVLSNTSDHLIDFHPVLFDQTGVGIQQGFEGVFVYPAHDLIQGTVAGVAVPCISAPLQVHFHAGDRPRWLEGISALSKPAMSILSGNRGEGLDESPVSMPTEASETGRRPWLISSSANSTLIETNHFPVGVFLTIPVFPYFSCSRASR